MTVNGIVATVMSLSNYNGVFVVNHVPLEGGSNIIAASATDTAGNTASVSITVNAVTTTPYVTLTANIESGIALLETYFSVSTAIPNAVTTYDMDFEGDSVIDYTGSTFEDISFTYTTEGIYYPNITVTDDQNNTYTDTIAIVVLNAAELDALLQAKWEAMKTALLAGDTEGSLVYFVDDSTDRYRQAFTSLGSSNVNSIFLSITELRLNTISGPIAQYWALRIEPEGTFAYPVTFVLDENGIWKIMGF